MFNIKSIPKDPGCYLLKDKNNRIIYVGKAKNLKKRINSYTRINNLDPKTVSLINNVESLDFLITDNEVEALILENNLIKKHKPLNNISLKNYLTSEKRN